MRTVVIEKVEEGVPPPTWNGFALHAHDVKSMHPSGLWVLDTGLSLRLPKGSILELEPSEGVLVVSWSLSGYAKFPPGRLVVVAIGNVRRGKPFARAWVVDSKEERVRFMEVAEGGGRIVRGDAKVADSAEDRESES